MSVEIVLGEKISMVNIKEAEHVIDITPGAKSVRLDVYLDDDRGTVYDLEMQTTAFRNLPRRLRYYQGVIDLNNIEKGDDYISLPNSVIIFICTFDYFGKGLPFYIFENRCGKMPELLLGDGTKKIFVNPYGETEDLTEEAAAFLKYIREHVSCDAFTEELETAVARARNHREWEVEYMEWRAFEMDIRIETACKGGRNSGRKTGRNSGRKTGRRV